MNQQESKYSQGRFDDDTNLISYCKDYIKDFEKEYIKTLEKEEQIESLYNAIERLTKEEKYIIQRLYFYEESENTVAKKLGISQQALNKKKKKY